MKKVIGHEHARLRAVLQVAESGLSLEHIASFPLTAVPGTLPCIEARNLMETEGFDVLALEDDDPRYRFVELLDLSNDDVSVAECARMIDTRHLLPASLSLADALDALRCQPYYFVFRNRSIEGIVTRADIQRAPVGMLTFGLIIAIEVGLNELIVKSCGDVWVDMLSTARRSKAEEVLQVRRRKNAELTLLDCLMLEDRMLILRKSEPLRTQLGFESGKEIRPWGESLKRLRDTLAHGGSMLDYEPDPEKSLELLYDVREFAHRVWDAVVDQ